MVVVGQGVIPLLLFIFVGIAILLWINVCDEGSSPPFPLYSSKEGGKPEEEEEEEGDATLSRQSIILEALLSSF